MTQLSESVCLSGIESKARWLRDDAVNLSFYVRQLPSRPEWETKAQDMLTQAEHELLAALQRVRDAKAEYSAKQVAA
jgi:hypothetical protein